MSAPQAWIGYSGWIVLALGLALSVLAYRQCSLQIHREAQARFEHDAREIHRLIADRLASYSGLLWGMRGFFHASPQMTRSRFSRFVRSLDLDKRIPAVVSVNFAERVSAAALADFERRVREDRSQDPRGHPEFRVRTGSPLEDYEVLVYLEPFEPARHVFGLDLAHMAQARFVELRRSGGLVSSGEVVAHQPGLPLALRLAVYRRGMPLDSPAQREAASAGSVGMGFSLLKLLQEAVPSEPLSRMRIRIHNMGRSNDAASLKPAGQGSLLIDSALLMGHPGVVTSSHAGLHSRTRLDFGGTMLEISIDSPLEAFTPSDSKRVPQVVLASGGALSVLLALFVALLLRSKARLEQGVRERSLELTRTNVALKKEMEAHNRAGREVMQALSTERRRHGQELHDNLGQQLTAAGFLVQALRLELERDGLAGEAADAAAIAERISGVISQTRSMSHRLSPVQAGPGGLVHALQGLAADTQVRHGIACCLQAEPHASQTEGSGTDRVLEHHLFHLVQEAVTCALDRGATRIVIALEASPVAACITDNGPMSKDANDAVLRIMAFRCRALGLAFGIARLPQGGLTLRIEGRPAA